MARRRELKNIANGLLNSFNSRNNDIDGYWGIGVLCLFAKDNEISEVWFDLMNRESSGAPSPIGALTARYREMLDRLLERRGLPGTWVKSAELSICFDAPFEHKFHYFGSALGVKHYICTLEITDDLGHKHSARADGNCWPHNPKKESRSGRWNKQQHTHLLRAEL